MKRGCQAEGSALVGASHCLHVKNVGVTGYGANETLSLKKEFVFVYFHRSWCICLGVREAGVLQRKGVKWSNAQGLRKN